MIDEQGTLKRIVLCVKITRASPRLVTIHKGFNLKRDGKRTNDNPSIICQCDIIKIKFRCKRVSEVKTIVLVEN